MKIDQLISISIFTILSVLTIYYWLDKWNTGKIKEGFAGEVLTQSDLARLTALNEPVPTDEDAIAAHQTLLRYIRNDFNKGIKFVIDFGIRFYGDNLPLREELDTRTLMDNYISPLQRQ